MALSFPNNPADLEIYDNYYWDNTNSVWRLLSDSLEIAANFSNTATGTYTDGYDYKYLTFTADGTLTVTRGGYADVLLVGGGGAGGSRFGGGGGGGGVLYIQNAYLPAGSLDVTVGAGGLGYSANQDAGFSGRGGQPSILWKYYAVGGGGGGALNNQTNVTNNYWSGLGHIGGSGGGGGGNNISGSAQFSPGGDGVTGQGKVGGLGRFLAAGGGGGAGTAGSDGIIISPYTGGDGGNGIANSITNSAVTYAGGGGGEGNGAMGSGGTGGGGDAGSPGTAGTANTGGGGGGSAYPNAGADGGSGIVIVRVRTN